MRKKTQLSLKVDLEIDGKVRTLTEEELDMRTSTLLKENERLLQAKRR